MKALGMFPYTRWLQLVVISLLPPPLKMLGVGIASYVIYRVTCGIIERAFAALETAALNRTGGYRRVTLRNDQSPHHRSALMHHPLINSLGLFGQIGPAEAAF